MSHASSLGRHIPSLGRHASTLGQSDTKPPEDVASKMARLRLEAARRTLNRSRSTSIPTARTISTSTPAYLNTWQHDDSIERVDNPQEEKMSKKRVPGPRMPKSWQLLFQRHETDVATSLPAQHLNDGLIRMRTKALSTLRPMSLSYLSRSRDSPVYSLATHCLVWLALDLAQIPREQSEALQVIDTLPVNLRERLADVASLVAPLDCHVATRLFTCAPESEHLTQDQVEDWQQLADGAEEDAFRSVNLAYSTMTFDTLQSLLVPASFPYLSHLNISHCVSLSASSSLLGILKRLPNLRSLAMTHIGPPSSTSQSSLLARMAMFLPRLESLNVSHNTWIRIETLRAVDWQHCWLHLAELGLLGCRLALAAEATSLPLSSGEAYELAREIIFAHDRPWMVIKTDTITDEM